MTVVAASTGTALWYLARGTGVVSLVFLTTSVVLGITTTLRWSSRRWPRFVVQFLHRNVSLLVLVFLALHIATVVTDSFAPIGWVDAVVPFASAYRPIWLGLGALAFDLLIALVVTSLLRHRLGFSAWRAVHWLAYLCWPLAVVHGLGTGSDTKPGLVLSVTVACVASVLVAGSVRIARGLDGHRGARASGLAALAFVPVLLATWLASGPMQAGWSRRAGTPATALASSSRPVATTGSASAPPTTAAPATGAASLPATGFDAQFTGTVRQSAANAEGQVVVSIAGDLSQGATGVLDVELRGQPITSGGIALDAGTVTITNASQHLDGSVVGLQGWTIQADVAGTGSTRMRLAIDLRELDQASGRMRGSVVATPSVTGNGSSSR
jgi:sulfoxide reductase heme-binding subunit YedZ